MGKLISFGKRKLTGFDWDKGNKDKNWLKHKVRAKECEELFFNKPLLFFEDSKHSAKEKRFVVYGRTDKRRKLSIIFTVRKGIIRVISARDQNKNERKIYENA